MDEEQALAQQQHRVMQQQQQQQLLMLQHLQRQQQQQDAMSRFPSNIDAHLRPQQQFLHCPFNAQSLAPNMSNPSFNAGFSHPQLFQMPSQLHSPPQLFQMPSQLHSNPQLFQMPSQLHSPPQGHQYQLPSRSKNLVINDSSNNNSNSSSSNPQQQQQQQHQQQHQQQQKTTGANPAELQMAYQDAWKVCHPDFKNPFTSLEDACERLLPYHVVADYEAEEDDEILETYTEGQMSRSQQWDNNIADKVAEFTATFEKQVLAFNIITRKRGLGEFRAEEKLMVEQLLLQEEKRAYLEMRAEIDSRQKMSQETTDPNLRIAMAHGEQTHGGSQIRRDMVSPPFRGSLHGFQVNNSPVSQEMVEQGQEVNYEDMNNGLGNNPQIDEKEPSENFLNDEETEDGDTGTQSEGHSRGALDLNTI